MTKSKSEIRRAAKSAVKALTIEQRQVKSALIFSHIASLPEVKSAKTIALYHALPDEVITEQFIATFAPHKHIVLPRVEGEDMEFYPYEPDNLERGAFGIIEPQGAEAIEPAQIDLIIVPGVAFTRSGKRCGRGKGYYDKYLSREGFRATKIGVCYAEQLAEDIPNEPHDIVMDRVLFG